MPLTIHFIYVNSPESKQRIRTMYNRIFTIAKQNLISKKQNAKVEREKGN